MKWLPPTLAAVLGIALIFGTIGYLNLSDAISDQESRAAGLAQPSAVPKDLQIRLASLEQRVSKLEALTDAPAPPGPIADLAQRMDTLQADLRRSESHVDAIRKTLTDSSTNSETDVTELRGNLARLRQDLKADNRRIGALQRWMRRSDGGASPGKEPPGASRVPKSAALADLSARMDALSDVTAELSTKAAALRRRMDDADTVRASLGGQVERLAQADSAYRARWEGAKEAADQKGLTANRKPMVDPLPPFEVSPTCDGLELATATWKPPLPGAAPLHLHLSPAGGNGVRCRLYASASPDPNALDAVRYRGAKVYEYSGGRCLCSMTGEHPIPMAEGQLVPPTERPADPPAEPSPDNPPPPSAP